MSLREGPSSPVSCTVLKNERLERSSFPMQCCHYNVSQPKTLLLLLLLLLSLPPPPEGAPVVTPPGGGSPLLLLLLVRIGTGDSCAAGRCSVTIKGLTGPAQHDSRPKDSISTGVTTPQDTRHYIVGSVPDAPAAAGTADTGVSQGTSQRCKAVFLAKAQ